MRLSSSYLFSADASLNPRLGGLAHYDTEADLTWLANANTAGNIMNRSVKVLLLLTLPGCDYI